MEKTAELAGLLAAHAVWSVYEGETLTPLLGVEMPDGTRALRQLTEETLEANVVAGQRWLAANPEGAQRGVLVYDGFLNLEEGKSDALLIEAHRYGEEISSFGMAIPYRHAKSSEGFAVQRPKFIATAEMEQELIQNLVDAFFNGVDSHERGARVWREHLDSGEKPDTNNAS